MNEKQQILYMQTRIVRLASEEWGRPISEIAGIFARYHVLQYIEECFGVFHVQGDEAILEDVENYLKNREKAVASGAAAGSVLFSDGQGACVYYIYGKCENMTAEKTVTEETRKNAIDLLVTMTVDELAGDLHQNPTELLLQFIVSKTGSLLYEEGSKLWWSGPSDIAEMFRKEMEKDKNTEG